MSRHTSWTHRICRFNAAASTALLLFVGPFSSSALAKRPAEPTSQSADVSLTVSDTPDSALLLDEITYTVNVSNSGPGSPSVWVNATLDGGGYTKVSSSQGTCSVNGSFYCPLGSLAARSSATVTVKVRPSRLGNISLSVSAASDVSDPSLSNNSETEYTYVMASPSASGCGGIVIRNQSCKLFASGGRLTATALHLENQFTLVCNPNYCPLLHWSGQHGVAVGLIDQTGRVIAECFSAGYCSASSDERILPGTLLTCVASEMSAWPAANAYACTG